MSTVNYERTGHKPTPRQQRAANTPLGLDHPAGARVVDSFYAPLEPTESYMQNIAQIAIGQMVCPPENLLVEWEGGVDAGGAGPFNGAYATMAVDFAPNGQPMQLINQEGATPNPPVPSTVFADIRRMLARSPQLVPGSS